jgi:hypothetical protein
MAFAIPRHWIERNAEESLLLRFICHRELFGLAYGSLQPEFMRNMPPRSGVYICPLVPTRVVFPTAKRPGDIDLMIIPYEENQLVLDRAMAIEVKVTRARFLNQGKSPNDFGYSQAESLLSLGFPYVAVAHLIISDTSPRDAWKLFPGIRLIGDGGRAGKIEAVKADPMPRDLIERGFGRLEKSCPRPEIGFVSAYLGMLDESGREKDATWYPMGKQAFLNPLASVDAAQSLGDLFERYSQRFLDNPRWPDDPIA